MSVKLLLPLCALDGVSLALIGWDQVMITAASEQERGESDPEYSCLSEDGKRVKEYSEEVKAAAVRWRSAILDRGPNA